MIERPRMPKEPEGGSQEQRAPKENLFALPKILDIEITRIRFREPRPAYVGRERIESSHGIELRVETDGPIPIRALSPALYIGNVAVDAYEEIGSNLYRFIAYRIDGLEEGASISFGWLDAARKIQTDFRFTPKNAEEEER